MTRKHGTMSNGAIGVGMASMVGNVHGTAADQRAAASAGAKF